jgi:hypothetical protein
VTLHYSAMTHAPVDAAEQIGVLRSARAVERVRKTMLARRFQDPVTGRVRLMTNQEVTDALTGRDQRCVVEAQLDNARQKHALRALRRAQRDDKDPFRWNPNERRVGRGGY